MTVSSPTPSALQLALEAIAGAKVDEDTDHEQLVALLQAIARAALEARA